MTTDVLSEVLRAVHLRGAVYFKVDCAAPFVGETPEGKVVAPWVLPGAEHVLEYHIVTRGTCSAGLIGEPAVELEAGDVVVFPQGDAHVMSSQPGMRGKVDLNEYLRPYGGALPIAFRLAPEKPATTQLICGFVGCDAKPFNPLLATLPRLVCMRKGDAGNAELVEQLMRLAVSECDTRNAGSETMLSRLSELLFVEVVRRYCKSLPDGTTGWLAGLRDELVGRALALLHAKPLDPWSLDSLAKQVGVSRSVLAERFVAFVGTPPMQYLARWRMQLAASMLSGTTATIAEVARAVGYGSEAALSRAFKRLVGVSPSAWREGKRPAAGFVESDEADVVGHDDVEADASDASA